MNISATLRVTEYLFSVDPAGTLCVENNSKDEYTLVSIRAVSQFSARNDLTLNLYKYIIDAMTYYFDGHFTESLIDKNKVDEIEKNI